MVSKFLNNVRSKNEKYDWKSTHGKIHWLDLIGQQRQLLIRSLLWYCIDFFIGRAVEKQKKISFPPILKWLACFITSWNSYHDLCYKLKRKHTKCFKIFVWHNKHFSTICVQRVVFFENVCILSYVWGGFVRGLSVTILCAIFVFELNSCNKDVTVPGSL